MDTMKIFTYVGAVTCFTFLVKVARHIHCYLRPSSLHRSCPPGKDSWALVTGASDGIGLGFAQELCSRGFNVFLHGRNRQKLLRVQEQLKMQWPTSKTKIIVFDATKPTEEMAEIVREVGNVNLTVLINNVGGATGVIATEYLKLEDTTHQQVQDLVSVNAVFLAQLTRELLPILQKNAPSVILNMTSAASNGIPWLCVYGGTKGFVRSFSTALSAEMRAGGHDVEVIGVIVGSVKSPGNDVDEGFFIPSSRIMARSALDRVGCGRSQLWAYWPHRLQGFVFEWMPERLLQLVLIRQVSTLIATRDEKKKRT
ncbi:hypothetical protein Egran_05255 [Elaphomyces granulatus]|uniref:Very-long-chain 3-oxoacyl-CoA reductase n=1 Tax=Elaphomyces granulatus TaxID=519963 RepID=A0A232LS64_9EURO|nr:hypothetical protein Egran_05255 [Elaphomyces granulatus]